MTEFADSPAGEKILWELAAKNLPKGKAGDYNQALMDLGAAICLPKNPRCLLCPLMKMCEARKHGTQESRPVLKPKKQVPQYIHAAAVIVERGRVLLSQRPANGLLGGMWEFPNARVEADPAKELIKAINAAYRLKVRLKRVRNIQVGESLGIVKHAYSHFGVIVHAFWCEGVSIPKNKTLKWVKLSELGNYPMGKADRQIAKMLG